MGNEHLKKNMFADSQAGKGDTLRPVDKEKYDASPLWDHIDAKKANMSQPKEVTITLNDEPGRTPLGKMCL